jgi:hypothetical protein
MMKVTLYGERLDIVVNALSKYLGVNGRVTNVIEGSLQKEFAVTLDKKNNLNVRKFLEDMASEYGVRFEIQEDSLVEEEQKDDRMSCAYLIF